MAQTREVYGTTTIGVGSSNTIAYQPGPEYVLVGECRNCGAPIWAQACDWDRGITATVPNAHFTCECRTKMWLPWLQAERPVPGEREREPEE